MFATTARRLAGGATKAIAKRSLSRSTNSRLNRTRTRRLAESAAPTFAGMLLVGTGTCAVVGGVTIASALTDPNFEAEANVGVSNTKADDNASASASTADAVAVMMGDADSQSQSQSQTEGDIAVVESVSESVSESESDADNNNASTELELAATVATKPRRQRTYRRSGGCPLGHGGGYYDSDETTATDSSDRKPPTSMTETDNSETVEQEEEELRIREIPEIVTLPVCWGERPW